MANGSPTVGPMCTLITDIMLHGTVTDVRTEVFRVNSHDHIEGFGGVAQPLSKVCPLMSTVLVYSVFFRLFVFKITQKLCTDLKNEIFRIDI